MSTNREKMEQARSLILQKKYDAARSTLHTVNHPLAQDWLEKIDRLDPPPPLYTSGEKPTPTEEKDFTTAAVIVLGLYIFVWIVGVVANIVYLKQARQAEAEAGHSLRGVGALRVERVIFMWLPIIIVLGYIGFLLVSIYTLNGPIR